MKPSFLVTPTRSCLISFLSANVTELIVISQKTKARADHGGSRRKKINPAPVVLSRTPRLRTNEPSPCS